jgi:hypothetical protein
VVKVAFSGAGGVEFTRNVVADLCSYPELTGDLDLALLDVNAERLAHAQPLATRIAAPARPGPLGPGQAPRPGSRQPPGLTPAPASPRKGELRCFSAEHRVQPGSFAHGARAGRIP